MSTVLPKRAEGSPVMAPTSEDVSAVLEPVFSELVAISSVVSETGAFSRGGEINPPSSEEGEVPVENEADAPTTSTGKGWNCYLALICVFHGYLTSLYRCCFRSFCVSP